MIHTSHAVDGPPLSLPIIFTADRLHRRTSANPGEDRSTMDLS